MRLAQDEPTFARILNINAAMDQKLEVVGKGILDAKLWSQEQIDGLLNGLVQAFGESKTILESIDNTTKAWAEEYRRQHPETPPAATPGTAAPPRIADNPGFDPSYNRPRDPDEPVGWNPHRTQSPTTPQKVR
jgi:hypothetical protein